jgi:hypothetical protein
MVGSLSLAYFFSGKTHFEMIGLFKLRIAVEELEI